MAYTNNFFKGVIDGKTIFNYAYKLDYDESNLDNRINNVCRLLNIDEYGSKDKFWQEVWDMGVCKSQLNTTDDLWSDTNVAKCLESMASYLLAKAPKDKRDNIKIYDDYELFKRILKEKELIQRYGEKDEEDIVVFKPKKNYKLDPNQTVTQSDKKKYKEIRDYDNYRNYLIGLKEDKQKRNELANKININTEWFKMSRGSDVYKFVLRQLPLVADDMLQVKIQRSRPIKWKSPLKDVGNEIDWEYLDMFDPSHVKPLLQCKGEIDISSDILIDIHELIEKTELEDRQREILSMWRADKTQQDIADRLGTSRQVVIKQLDKIVKKVIDTYEKEYEENYYYLNIVKGKYKTCSKCGKVKLLQRFNKNNRRKDGYENTCRKCQCK